MSVELRLLCTVVDIVRNLAIVVGWVRRMIYGTGATWSVQVGLMMVVIQFIFMIVMIVSPSPVPAATSPSTISVVTIVLPFISTPAHYNREIQPGQRMAGTNTYDSRFAKMKPLKGCSFLGMSIM